MILGGRDQRGRHQSHLLKFTAADRGPQALVEVALVGRSRVQLKAEAVLFPGNLAAARDENIVGDFDGHLEIFRILFDSKAKRGILRACVISAVVSFGKAGALNRKIAPFAKIPVDSNGIRAKRDGQFFLGE